MGDPAGEAPAATDAAVAAAHQPSESRLNRPDGRLGPLELAVEGKKGARHVAHQRAWGAPATGTADAASSHAQAAHTSAAAGAPQAHHPLTDAIHLRGLPVGDDGGSAAASAAAPLRALAVYLAAEPRRKRKVHTHRQSGESAPLAVGKQSPR